MFHVEQFRLLPFELQDFNVEFYILTASTKR